MDRMDYAIKVLQHGPTNPLSPCPPPPLGLAWWLGQRPSSRHSERLCMTSPWKRRRLSLHRRQWCSAPALGGHESYYSPGKDSENVESCKSIEFFTLIFFSVSTSSLPPHRRADGEQGLVWRKASNVAFNIMHA